MIPLMTELKDFIAEGRALFATAHAPSLISNLFSILHITICLPDRRDPHIVSNADCIKVTWSNAFSGLQCDVAYTGVMCVALHEGQQIPVTAGCCLVSV